MKIITSIVRNRVEFGDLEHDNAFIYAEALYVKMDWPDVKPNAVRLSDFTPASFLDDDEVIPVNIEVRIMGE